MHILLFGGSFDPPHLGHQLVIEQAFEIIPQIDELWLLPAFNHTFDKKLTAANHRLKMSQLLIKEVQNKPSSSHLKLCSIEIDQKPQGSTHETLQLLRQNDKASNENHTYSFLMGSDQLPSFNNWINWEQLLKEMHFYVYPRGSHRHPVTHPHMTLLESPTQVITNISSSLIKQRLKSKLPINHLLPKSIAAYIKTHQLYPV
jgi:nicotinate-nucleotide adenylyltransferase